MSRSLAAMNGWDDTADRRLLELKGDLHTHEAIAWDLGFRSTKAVQRRLRRLGVPGHVGNPNTCKAAKAIAVAVTAELLTERMEA